MNPIEFLQRNYPCLRIIIYSDSGLLQYQFKVAKNCENIENYSSLDEQLVNLVQNPLSTGEPCNVIIKVILPNYTSIFYFYRNELNKLELSHTMFADGTFIENMKALIANVPQ